MSDTIPTNYFEQLRAFVKTLTPEQADVILSRLPELISSPGAQVQPSPEEQIPRIL